MSREPANSMIGCYLYDCLCQKHGSIVVNTKILSIVALPADIQHNGLLQGIGKPEFLKRLKAYSRHSDDANRLIYSADENKNLQSIACKGHYT
jgi:toxin YoeB